MLSFKMKIAARIFDTMTAAKMSRTDIGNDFELL
jgi:hypothetical protein